MWQNFPVFQLVLEILKLVQLSQTGQEFLNFSITNSFKLLTNIESVSGKWWYSGPTNLLGVSQPSSVFWYHRLLVNENK